jgi:hypothetical protein
VNQLKITREVKVNGFLHGMVVYGCIKSLYQDIIGKEAYLQEAERNWMDASITVPLAIILLVLVVLDLVLKAARK